MSKLPKVKNKFDPRHLERQKTVQELFAWSYFPTNQISPNTQLVIDKQSEIDSIIIDNAPKWPIDKINRVDLCVLRLAIYELLYTQKVPYKVIIDEAVELAKDLGAESSGPFVNGVLGSTIKKLNLDHDQPSI